MFYDYPSPIFSVDKDKCVKCGVCYDNCIDYLTKDNDGFPMIKNLEVSLGCVSCGNCMMRCPAGAIEIKGERVDKSYLVDCDNPTCDYEALFALMLKRRSCRRYKKDSIPQDDLFKIINAAATAPISSPPIEIEIAIINDKNKMNDFEKEVICDIKRMANFFSSPFSIFLKLFLNKAKFDFLTKFVKPLFKLLLLKNKKGEDALFHGAPSLMVFHCENFVENTDVVINQSFATLAIQTLGYGSCFIGSLPPLLNNSNKLKKMFGIPLKNTVCGALVLGKPANGAYRHSIKRTFKSVRFL